MNFALPYYRRLTSHHGWVQDSRYDYSVVRLHFATVPERRQRLLCVGPPVAEVTVPKGVTEDYERERKVSVQKTLERSMVEELIIETEVFSELAAAVTAGASRFGFTIDQNLTRTLKDRYAESSRLESRVATATTTTTEEIARVKITVDGDVTAGDRMMVASNYREVIETVYLAYIDVLGVRYDHRFPLTPRKRLKVPEYRNEWGDDPRKRPNVSRALNWPIATIRYWKHVPDSYPVFAEDKYPDTHIEVGDFEVYPPSGSVSYPLKFSSPSLYNAANSAFKLRYAKFRKERRGGEDETEEFDLAD